MGCNAIKFSDYWRLCYTGLILLLSYLKKRQMEKKQALQVLKEVLDAATKSGVFPNMDASFTAAQAYNIVANEILKDNGSNSIND